MGLRCLLGHEYANREVEREREERGNEVVVTYRTVETCDRCGERRIVSENKEVRPVRNPQEDEVTTGLGGGVTADMSESAGEDDAPTADAGPTPDPEMPDDESTPTPSTATADTADVPDAEGAASVDVDAESEPATTDADETASTDDVDDAIILDDDSTDDSETDRGHGEWPETADADPAPEPDPDPEPDTVDDGATVVSGDDGWPDTDGEDEGFDAEPSDGTPTEVSFGGGLAPERADEAANGETEAAATNGTTGGSVAGKQFVAAEEVERVTEESDGETEFFCPNCGYARVAGGSSMRAGDICPECHKGYIAERER